jgi:hypothetical protein
MTMKCRLRLNICDDIEDYYEFCRLAEKAAREEGRKEVEALEERLGKWFGPEDGSLIVEIDADAGTVTAIPWRECEEDRDEEEDMYEEEELAMRKVEEARREKEQQEKVERRESPIVQIDFIMVSHRYCPCGAHFEWHGNTERPRLYTWTEKHSQHSNGQIENHSDPEHSQYRRPRN